MLRRSQDAALRRHFVVYTQNAALVTTTRTEGARVVLTLPVTRKRLREGAGPGRARAFSDGFERESKRDPKREKKNTTRNATQWE